MRAPLLLAVAAVLVCAASRDLPAQPTDAGADPAKAMAGTWEISNGDRDKVCLVTFKADAAARGYKLEFDRPTCIASFPPLRDAAAWLLNGDDVHVLDAKGKPLYEFNQVETGMYESLKAGQPLTFLQNAALAAAGAANKTADQMTGEWNVVVGGEPPICTLSLSNKAAGTDFAVTVKPGCAAIVTAFAPVTWRMERGDLLLKSARGATWRFEDSDGNWQRVPEGQQSLMLTRQ
jgi:hypothetical protein